MFVIGTAGHVDHGKSTLVKALTGMNPDRLKEEQVREMTIELGFAWLKLSDGNEIGIIDVPGHRNFVNNMLAGVGGIDLALLVIAADEGIMPQTKEHLAILDLLNINPGIIVLTKTDLVKDGDWLDLVEVDILEAVKNTGFHNAPIVRVSAKTGSGLEQLISQIQALIPFLTPKVDLGRARLPIDRVFTLAGFGTVVTGTLLDGKLEVGQEIEILPGGNKAKIRGLQTHKKKENVAFPGSRTAVNLSGIDVNQIHRGQVLVSPGKYEGSARIDAELSILEATQFELKHNQQIKLFMGTNESIGRVRLLGKEIVKPGQTSWIQVETKEPMVCVRGDRFIIRVPSPEETVGGGVVINPDAKVRYKRFSPSVLERMSSYRKGGPREIFLQAVEDAGWSSFDQIIKNSKINKEMIMPMWNSIMDENLVIQLDFGDALQNQSIVVCSKNWFSRIVENITTIVDGFHRQYHLRAGIPKEELKSKLGLDTVIFNKLIHHLDREKIILLNENTISLPEFRPELTGLDVNAAEGILNRLAQSKFSPPNLKEFSDVELELINYLTRQNKISNIGNDFIFLREAYQEMEDWVIDTLKKKDELILGEFRDQFNTTRKYAQAFLEFLDKKGVTIRDGDSRKLRQFFNT